MAGGQSEADDDSAADHAELRAEYERLLKTQSTGNITEQTAHHSNRLHGMDVCVERQQQFYTTFLSLSSLSVACGLWLFFCFCNKTTRKRLTTKIARGY